MRADAMAVIPDEYFMVSFDLLLVSYTLPAGHQLQVAIDGADSHHFEVLKDGPGYLKVVVDARESFLELPVVGCE